MATTFASLYPYARTLLGDFGPTTYVYANDHLDLGFRRALLEESTFEETPTGSITPVVTAKADILRFALRVAVALLSPSSNALSYRGPVLSVSRENARKGHLGYLEGLLDSTVNGGTPTIGTYTDLQQYYDAPDEVANTLTDLLS
jgi:hypothetical protein